MFETLIDNLTSVLLDKRAKALICLPALQHIAARVS